MNSTVSLVDGFTPFRDIGGFDLSGYQKELQHDRSIRTNNFRRINNHYSKATSSKAGKLQRHKSLSSIQLPEFLTSKIFIQLLANQQTIDYLCNNVIEYAQNTPQMFRELVANDEVVLTLIEAMTQGYPEPTMVSVLKILAAMFPLFSQIKMVDLIDGGITLEFLNLLESNSHLVLCTSICLISVLARHSGYARDSLISYGIHEMLINLIHSQAEETIVVNASEALQQIFANQETIDNSIFLPMLEQIYDLLQIQCKQALIYILDVLVEMSNKMPSIVFQYFKKKIDEFVFEAIKDPELTEVSLRLIGNMAVSQPSQIKAMLNNGLIDILTGILAQDQYSADVFWIYSNLLESLPSIMVSIFNIDFISNVTDLASYTNFDLKKEASFFLSTLTIFINNDELARFADSQEILDLFVEMLGCGDANIILRCMDSIIKMICFSAYKDKKAEFAGALIDTGIKDRLEELLDQDNQLLKERANYLLNQIEPHVL